MARTTMACFRKVSSDHSINYLELTGETGLLNNYSTSTIRSRSTMTELERMLKPTSADSSEDPDRLRPAGAGDFLRRSRRRSLKLSKVGLDKSEDLLQEPLLGAQRISVGDYIGGPIDHIKHLVQPHPGEAHVEHSLFIELLHLEAPNTSIWHEKARWIKFQETAEEDGHRWSKPHISLLTLPGLLQVKNCLFRGAVLLDLEAENFEEVTDAILDQWERNLVVAPEDAGAIKILLEGKKKHLLIHHVAEEIGIELKKVITHSISQRGLKEVISHPSFSNLHGVLKKKHPPFSEQLSSPAAVGMPRSLSKVRFSIDDHELEGIPEADSQASHLNDLHHSQSEMPAHPTMKRSESKVSTVMYHMHKKLQEGSEGVLILTGSSDKLQKTAAAFVRIREACDFQELLEVPVRLRFFIIIITPTTNSSPADAMTNNTTPVCDIGAHFGALLSDEVFACVAYRAKEPKDIAWAVDEFLSNIVLIPPGKWDRSCFLEPSEQPVKAPSRAAREAKQTPRTSLLPQDAAGGGHEEVTPGLVRTGRLFGGLISDVGRKLQYYRSDYLDAINPHGIGQCLATSIFLFFALLTNIVTFGGVMEKQLHSEMAVLETIMAGLICGVVFAVFSGQPMNILSATGPVLVFEKILYKICESNDWSFMAGRFWVGMWTTAILLLIVATDMSALVALITRFTEECFATLIALLFIVQAFEEIFAVASEAPLTKDPDYKIRTRKVSSFINHLLRSSTSPKIDCLGCRFVSRLRMNSHKQMIAEKLCERRSYKHAHYGHARPQKMVNESGWTIVCMDLDGSLTGMQCNFLPDVFLMSFILFFGTFLLIVFLKGMKTSSFFPTKIRMLLSDFSSFLAILTMSCVSHSVGLEMPTLTIPTKIQPTSGRSWLVSPFQDVPMYLPILCLFPAILFSILVFMDQQITAVIVNRKDNKLKKEFGYHLDLFILSLLFIVCSFFGIPFFVAATVLSIVHVQSLRVESETAAPGEKPQFLGIREQRLTAMLSAILIGLSVFMAQLIRLIPTPVLYGVFLFMGYSSLQGQQLVDRIMLAFIPPKYQPDHVYLRVVPMLRVHLYTVIQLLSLALLFVIKYVKKTSMLFPLMDDSEHEERASEKHDADTTLGNKTTPPPARVTPAIEINDVDVDVDSAIDCTSSNNNNNNNNKFSLGGDDDDDSDHSDDNNNA